MYSNNEVNKHYIKFRINIIFHWNVPFINSNILQKYKMMIQLKNNIDLNVIIVIHQPVSLQKSLWIMWILYLKKNKLVWMSWNLKE